MNTIPNALIVEAPEGVPYVDFTREFDAPIEAVYRAHVDPELIGRWLGPNGYEMVIERYEVKTGGGYRYTHRDPNGDEYVFNGVFHRARENDLIIQTFEFEGFPDTVSIETVRFESLGDGRTRLSGRAVYPSQEARDGMVESGMERGMSEGYERLDQVLAS